MSRYKPGMFKKIVREHLYAFLYSPMDHKLDQKLKSIIMRNTNALASSHASFVYRKELYVLNDKEKLPRVANRLSNALHEEMNEYLEQVSLINIKEKPYVMGFIDRALNAADDLHDYFRLMPEPLHQPLKTLSEVFPPGNGKLSDDEVETFLKTNNDGIEKVKSRLVRNLIES